MNSHEDDEEEGPSVDSAVAEERIAARRIRIQRRLEAAKRFAPWVIIKRDLVISDCSWLL